MKWPFLNHTPPLKAKLKLFLQTISTASPLTLITTIFKYLRTQSIIVLPCNSHTSGYCLKLLRNSSRYVQTFHMFGHCVLHSKFFVPVYFKNYIYTVFFLKSNMSVLFQMTVNQRLRKNTPLVF